MFCFVFTPTVAKTIVGDILELLCYLKCLDPWLFGQLCIVILVITLSPCVCERENRRGWEEGREVWKKARTTEI